MLQSRDVATLRVQTRLGVFAMATLSQTNERGKKKDRARAREREHFKGDVHDVQCNMEMMTIPMILVIKKKKIQCQRNLKKEVCSFLHELHEKLCSTRR